MHTASAMEDRAARRRATAEWIRGLVGTRTLKDAAADISAVTEWSIDHSRLSRYADPDGTTAIGPDVVGHFTDYAKARRLPALDLTPPAPVLSLEEQAVIEAHRLADAAERQADAAEAQVELLSQLVAHLTGETPVIPGTSERVAAFLAGVAARSRQPADPPTPPARS